MPGPVLRSHSHVESKEQNKLMNKADPETQKQEQAIGSQRGGGRVGRDQPMNVWHVCMALDTDRVW